ncbi:MAG: ATP-binding protein [Bdellovibrionales bacterium]
MKVHSLVQWGLGFRKIEVEVNLAPGLPTMQILGQPDKVIKESAWRIRSAFDRQGFQWPTSRQILVNLKPSHIKKVGSGLDLAIASALLWETGQVPVPEEAVPLLYGELSLTGDVSCPPHFVDYQSETKKEYIYTGKTEQKFPFGSLQISQLSDLGNPLRQDADWSSLVVDRPEHGEWKFSRELAKIIAIVAHGEHSALFAGPAGTGKTTVAHAIWSLLQEPAKKDVLLLRQIARRFGQTLSWRPFVNPHHSMPQLSLIGGGNSPRPGEITRAHGGVLLFDELLEFQPKVLESLREPMESGMVSISRGSEVEVYPSQFLFLATTNLCRCGEFVPDRWNRCRCTDRSRMQYQEKLSGPILDRISVKVLSHEWQQGPQEILSKDILKRLEKSRAFILESRAQVRRNSSLSLQDLEPMLTKSSLFGVKNGVIGSHRRYLQWLQVARSVADLESSLMIEPHHLEEARKLGSLELHRPLCQPPIKPVRKKTKTSSELTQSTDSV